jgi:hypothetical protein
MIKENNSISAIVVHENKKYYFRLYISPTHHSTFKNLSLEDENKIFDSSFDAFKQDIEVKEDYYSFLRSDDRETCYYLKCENRKRLSQLLKSCKRNFPQSISYKVSALEKRSYFREIDTKENDKEN